MTIKVEIRTIHTDAKSKLKASANVVLDDSFVIRNVRLIQNDDRTFVSMPSNRYESGDWVNVCHPITTDFREKLETVYIAEYNSHLSKLGLVS